MKRLNRAFALCNGFRPWRPSRSALEPIVLVEYEIPRLGIYLVEVPETGGKRDWELFRCLNDDDSVGVWQYQHLTDEEADQLQDDSSDSDVWEQVRMLSARRYALALSLDNVIRHHNDEGRPGDDLAARVTELFEQGVQVMQSDAARMRTACDAIPDQHISV